MSAMARFGPKVAKTMLAQQHRHMASVTSTQIDPIQKLFLDKIKEFKTTSKGLDPKHQKLMDEEMNRLKRVYKVDDEGKLAQIDTKFAAEADVALHDLDSSKELREKIYSGDYQKQLAAQPKPKSALLESIKYREPDGFHLPLINKPNKLLLQNAEETMEPPEIGSTRPDYEIVNEKVTPESLQRDMRVKFGDKMPTIDDEKSPQRDLVNFPRQPQLLDTPPTVGHIIPASWFKFFYPKTGVTGGYVFGISFTTFLFSKEWLIMEHETLSGLSLIVLWAYLINKFGPQVSGWVRAQTKKEIDMWENWQKGTIETLSKIKDLYAEQLDKGKVIDELYSARRQDVDMQIEFEYRKRLQAIYNDTKRRLNYLVAVADTSRDISQKNMVNWVVSNVHSSIGPKQEEEYLTNCIGNLKQLANKNVKAI